MTKRACLRCGIALGLLLTNCGVSRVLGGEGSGGDSESTTDDAGGSTTGSTTSTATSQPPSDTDDDATTGSVFIEDPDGGPGSVECSTLIQDCPPTFKCNAWANDGGNAWNATKCVPVDPDPDEVGEPCTVEGSGVSGLDSCVVGAICWDVNPETSEGYCVAYCQGSEANPVCADPASTCEGRDILLCLPGCCPIEQNCHNGDACIPLNERFVCVWDASGDAGAFGDPCEYVNVCDPGLMCANVDVAPAGLPCEGSVGCCLPFCPVSADACGELDPAMECVPWFEAGTAPPGQEDIGVCMVAQ